MPELPGDGGERRWDSTQIVIVMLAVLVLLELVLLVTLLNRIGAVQQEVHDAVEVHRCRNEAVHRQILEALRSPYPTPEVAPDCSANARYKGEFEGR